eukprot:6178554-Pleurochrysis_carterae.AAC.2
MRADDGRGLLERLRRGCHRATPTTRQRAVGSRAAQGGPPDFQRRAYGTCCTEGHRCKAQCDRRGWPHLRKCWKPLLLQRPRKTRSSFRRVPIRCG